MKWLLDTNVLSESVRSSPSRVVIAWLTARQPDDVAISIVTLAELRDGATTAVDKTRRERLMRWVDLEIAASFRDRTLPLTAEILVDWFRLARRFRTAGDPHDPVDLLIASTARVHDLILASRNVRHFAGTGVVVYDPWTGKTHTTNVP